jgi:hypothetical protein
VLGDPDNDGMSNLAEYAIGCLPGVNQGQIWWVGFNQLEQKFVLHCPRSLLAPDVKQIVVVGDGFTFRDAVEGQDFTVVDTKRNEIGAMSMETRYLQNSHPWTDKANAIIWARFEYQQ